ncbi:MAG: TonB-dependent receptor, partial [Sinobacteraceae bacterium]|nr:TonB-dependent receptor [Nevskiaceae bacterium]
MTKLTARRALAAPAAAGALVLVSSAAFGQAAPTQVAAANTSADTGGLEEIIVTARYRVENLQQTPVAITAVTSQDIEARGFTNSSDIAYAVPNASFRPAQAAFGKTQTAFIRGVGQFDFNFAFEPGVGIYVDDVYYPTTMSSQFDLMDLERVEVLRGPQGTLFGRGSIGGAVRYISKPPTGDNTGYIEGTVGDFHRVDLRAGYDFALIPDKLFARITGVSYKQDGYVDRIDFACEYPQLSGTLPPLSRNRGTGCKLGTMGGTDVNGARALLRYLASDSLTINLTLDYQRDDSEAAPDTLLQAGPLVGGFLTWSNAMQAKYGVPYDSRFVPQNPYVSYATFQDPYSGLSFEPRNTLNQKGIAGTADWKINDAVDAKLIVAWRNWNSSFATDQGDAPLDVSIVDGLVQFTYRTVEMRFSGNLLDNKLNWTAGGFYYDGDANTTQEVNLPGANIGPYLANPVQNSLLVNGLELGHFRNYSAFLHTVYSLTDKLRLTLGGRYSKDQKADNFDNTIVKATINNTSSRGDWRIGLDYQIDPRLLVYTSASTGYRPPAFNPRPFQADQFVSVSGESLVAYELGEKADLWDRKLRLNAAAFYSDYRHRIVPTGGTDCLKNPDGSVVPGPLPNPQGGPACLVNSIPNTLYVNSPGKIYGGEIETELRPIEPLLISASGGLTKFSLSGNPAITGQTPNGEPQYVPKWNAALSGQYTFTLPDGSTLVPRYDAYLQTQICTRSAIPAAGYTGLSSCVGGYTLHNARIQYATPEHTWTAAFGVSNLT